jgi:predicted nucleic acid-binding Zn ribbon protein
MWSTARSSRLGAPDVGDGAGPVDVVVPPGAGGRCWCAAVTPRRGDEPIDAGEPMPLSSALDAVVRSLSPGTSAKALGGVFGRWGDIVGEQIATHVTPVKLEDGRLVVAVLQPGWATQMRYLHDDVLARINAVLGEGTVHQIDVKVTGASRAEQRSGNRGTHRSAPGR